MSSEISKVKEYSTDGKVTHFTTEEDINDKLGKIIGKKFTDYRKVWDAANNFEIVTDFPLFLHLDMNISIAEIWELEVLFVKMVPGSVCLLDDFSMDVAFNQMKADLDWFTNKSYYICEYLTSHGIIVKI